MTKGHFTFNSDDEKSLKLAAKIKNKSEYFAKLFSDVANGRLTYDDLSIKDQIDIARLSLIKTKGQIGIQDLRIKTALADNVDLYFKVFGTYPSSRGLRVLQHKSNSDENPTILKKIIYLPKFNIMKSYGKFNGMCKICQEYFENNNEDSLITIIEDHIKDEHNQEPYTESKT